jgi:hypothetical protein
MIHRCKFHPDSVLQDSLYDLIKLSQNNVSLLQWIQICSLLQSLADPITELTESW